MAATPVCAVFRMDAGDRTLGFESMCQVIGTRFGGISADFLHDVVRKLSPGDAQAKQAFEHLPRVACATERAWEQQSTSKVYCSRWWRARNSSIVLGGIGSVMAHGRVSPLSHLSRPTQVYALLYSATLRCCIFCCIEYCCITTETTLHSPTQATRLVPQPFFRTQHRQQIPDAV